MLQTCLILWKLLRIKTFVTLKRNQEICDRSTCILQRVGIHFANQGSLSAAASYTTIWSWSSCHKCNIPSLLSAALLINWYFLQLVGVFLIMFTKILHQYHNPWLFSCPKSPARSTSLLVFEVDSLSSVHCTVLLSTIFSICWLNIVREIPTPPPLYSPQQTSH